MQRLQRGKRGTGEGLPPCNAIEPGSSFKAEGRETQGLTAARILSTDFQNVCRIPKLAPQVVPVSSFIML
jgi:hypothetical protein